MKITWKDCFKVIISILIIYLCVFYWENVANLLGVLLSASLPIIFGLIIAYVLNILMSFYEKHYFTR